MRESVLTSPLIKERAETIVPKRIQEIEDAIAQRNFQVFGDLTMKVGLSFV
jgi:diphosphomevalonate decarboxylase